MRRSSHRMSSSFLTASDHAIRARLREGCSVYVCVNAIPPFYLSFFLPSFLSFTDVLKGVVVQLKRLAEKWITPFVNPSPPTSTPKALPLIAASSL